MSHLLPPQGHPAREMFAVEDLVAVALGQQPVLCSIYRLKRAAREFFAEADAAAKRVVYFHVRAADDQLELISVGRRDGWRREWVFGPVGRKARLL